MDLCRSNISWAQSCKHIKVTRYIHTTELGVVTWVMSTFMLKSLAFANLNFGIQTTVKIDVPLSRLTVVSVERHEPSPGRDSAHRRTFSQTRRRGCWWQLQSEIGQMPQAEQDKLGPNCLQN